MTGGRGKASLAATLWWMLGLALVVIVANASAISTPLLAVLAVGVIVALVAIAASWSTSFARLTTQVGDLIDPRVRAALPEPLRHGRFRPQELERLLEAERRRVEKATAIHKAAIERDAAEHCREWFDGLSPELKGLLGAHLQAKVDAPERVRLKADKLAGEAERLSRLVEEKERSLRQANEEQGRLQAELQEANEDLDAYETDLDALEAERDELKAERRSLAQRAGGLKAQNKKLRQRLALLEQNAALTSPKATAFRQSQGAKR